MGLFSKKPTLAAPRPAPSDESPVSGMSRPLTFVDPAAQPSDAAAGRPVKRSKRINRDEFDALQARLAEMQVKLAAAEQERAIVDSRLRTLDATTVALRTQRNEAANTDPAANPSTAPDELSTQGKAVHEMRVQLGWLLKRADAFAVSHDEMHSQLEAINERPTATAEVEAMRAQIVGEVEAERTAHAEETAKLIAQLSQLAERVSATAVDARQTSEQVAVLDQRISNVGTELANQLAELGNDIDQLQRTPTKPTDEQVATLQAGQAKLAEEQARYEIAFRQDLATLAEQLRRAARGS